MYHREHLHEHLDAVFSIALDLWSIVLRGRMMLSLVTVLVPVCCFRGVRHVGE